MSNMTEEEKNLLIFIGWALKMLNSSERTETEKEMIAEFLDELKKAIS